VNSIRIFQIVAAGICAIGIAVASFLFVLPNILVTNNIEAALSLPFQNGLVQEKYIDGYLRHVVAAEGDIPSKFNDAAIDLARQSFRAEPLSGSAIKLLALQAGNEGKGDAAFKTMKLLGQLTKRDALTNIWLAQKYGDKQEIDQILHYYDITIRTSDRQAAYLLGLMVSALQDDRFIEPISVTLASNPSWSSEFWRLAIQNQDAIKNAAILRLKLSELDSGVGADAANDRLLLYQLGRMREFGMAWDLRSILARAPAKSGNQLLNGNFSKAVDLLPFDWRIYSDGTILVDLVPDSGALILNATSAGQHLAAEQLVKLSPGKYRASMKAASYYDGETMPSIELRCATRKSITLGNFSLPKGKAATSHIIEVPENDCQFYWVRVYLIADRANFNDDVILENLSLSAE
jgi:hypothetical protein